MISAMLNQYIVEKSINNNWPITKIRASSIADCSRLIVYNMLGYNEPVTEPRVLTIMENGNYFHNRMEALFREAGILIGSEIKLKNEELNISSRLDALIKNPHPGKINKNICLYSDDKIVYEGCQSQVAIVEFKSVNDKKFQRIKQYGADKKHIAQLQLYLMLTDIQDGLLFYENKNTQEWVEKWIKSDIKYHQHLINKINVINYCVENLKIPDREFKRDSYECKYCNHKEKCWSPSANKISLDKII